MESEGECADGFIDGKTKTQPAASRGSSSEKISGPDQVSLETYTPTEIEIEAQSAQGGYVLIDDQYDPDWQVQVNGLNAELLRADYILRAVEIPPGHSTVSLHYIAHDHIAGVRLAAVVVNNFSDGIMLAAWLIAGVAIRWSCKRRSFKHGANSLASRT